jgi:putative ABC transport system permease protein
VDIWKDVRFAWRTLAKSPGFTAVAVLSLGLGIGANTALFSLVNGLLLRHLPVAHPEQLAAVGIPSRVNSVSDGTPQFGLFSMPLYRALRDTSRSFDGLLASGRTGRLDVRAEGAAAGAEMEHPAGRLVTGNYFSVLGVGAAVGRTFTEDDDRAGGASPPVAVLAYQYWKRRFGADPRVLGKGLTINGGLFTVIGVAAPGFNGEVVGARADLWLPTSQQPLVNPGRNWLQNANTCWLLMMGRLKPGVTLERAQAELDPLAHRLVQALPDVRLDADDLAGIAADHVKVSAGGLGFSSVRAHFSQPLLLLFGMVGVVLLVCCANIANLLLTRAAGRSREIAVRLAIGAGRSHVVGQLLTECLVLSLLGTVCGALLSVWGSRLLLRLASGGPNPIPLDVHPDLRVLGFTVGMALLTAMLFGLAPGLRAVRVNLLTALKPSMGRSGGAARQGGGLGVRKALVIAQVAVSLLLMTGAGLLTRSLTNLTQQDVGFEQDRLLVVETDPVASGYGEKQMDALMRDLSTSLAELPGVSGVATSYNGLFSGTESATLLGLGDLERTGRDDRIATYDQVGPDYFQVVGAHVLGGRGIEARDTATSPRVAVLSRRMARYLYPGIDPIGHHIIMGDLEHPVPVEVVGVVSDIKESNLAEEPSRRFFVPISQRPDAIGALRLIVRSTGDPGRLKNQVETRMTQRHPGLRLLDVSPVADLMRDDIREQRLLAQLSSFFGVLALLLAVTGLYGVMSYTTSLRTSEIGVRMALGAESATVLRMVLGESLGLLAGGVALGVVLAAGALRVLSSSLFGLSATDPPTIGTAIAVLAGAALLAAYLPARRASRVDPMVALRDE